MKNAYELAEIILKSRPDKNGELKSSDSFTSIELYGISVCKKVQDMKFCECFHLENASGTGMITLYHVFPGIDLVYNDMHMEYCNKEQKPASSVMEINYCMEGRCECVFEQNEYGYIAAGDLSFCSLKKSGHVSEFPTSHYHGITITLDFSMITDEMKRILQLLSVNLEKISNILNTAEGNKFKIAVFGTGIHRTTEGGVTTVNHLVNVINNGLTRL